MHLNDVDQIIVDGCGIPQFNGVYTLVNGFRQNGALVYTKKGKWGVHVRNCVILRTSSHSWCIGHWNGLIDMRAGEPASNVLQK